MTKRIVSFGAILALLALPLAAQAQPTSAPVGAGVATSKATRVAGTSESTGASLLSTDQTAKVHEYVTKEIKTVRQHNGEIGRWHGLARQR
jgi:hypothetical protein